MTKQKFLKGLKESLMGKLSPVEINNQLLYYERYIDEQVGMGKPEVQVLQELGDPRWIAKTIVETQGSAYTTTGTYYDEETQQTQPKENIKGWNEKLNGALKIIWVVLVIIFVLAVIFSVIRIMLPIVIPVILILAVVSLLRRKK